MATRILDTLIPVIAGVLLAFFGWLAVGSLRAEYTSLTRDDEFRIVRDLQVYSDKQFASLASDLKHVRDDISRLEILQSQILASLQDRDR